MSRRPFPCGFGKKCKMPDKLVHFKFIRDYKCWVNVEIEPGVFLPFHPSCYEEWIKNKQNKKSFGFEVGLDRGMPTAKVKFEKEF